MLSHALFTVVISLGFRVLLGAVAVSGASTYVLRLWWMFVRKHSECSISSSALSVKVSVGTWTGRHRRIRNAWPWHV
jgi:hypothetical protein